MIKQWIFIGVYETEQMMNVDKRLYKQNKTQDVSQQTKQFYYLGDYKVLIITANGGNKYKQMLSNHGLKAYWLDPFEKSPVHAEQLLVSHDIVLICLDSVRHHIIKLVRDAPEVKYQFLKHHNEEIIYNRVSLVIRQYSYNNM